MLRPRYQSDLLELVSAIGERRWALVILPWVMKRLFIEAFEQKLKLLLKELTVGLSIEQRRANGFHFAGVVAAARLP
jgi:hypothetical protein